MPSLSRSKVSSVVVMSCTEDPAARKLELDGVSGFGWVGGRSRGTLCCDRDVAEMRGHLDQP